MTPLFSVVVARGRPPALIDFNGAMEVPRSVRVNPSRAGCRAAQRQSGAWDKFPTARGISRSLGAVEGELDADDRTALGGQVTETWPPWSSS